MAFRILMIVVLLGGAFYIVHMRTEPKVPAPPPQEAAQVQQMDATPILALDEAQRNKIRQAAKDSDPSVRWAAIELLYRIHDPQAVPLMRDTLSMELDPDTRQKAVVILKQAAQQSQDKHAYIDNLLLILKDTDPHMRIAGLFALGEIGDKRAVPQVTELINDPDPEVRLQALDCLSQIQRKKEVEYQKLTQDLRNQYEPLERAKLDER